MPAKPISLGSLNFTKKEDAAAYLKDMLYRYDLGDKVSSRDADTLMAALKRHPNAEEKIGCGISSFSVRSADFGTRCFWMNRTDGMTEKFSYITCVYG